MFAAHRKKNGDKKKNNRETYRKTNREIRNDHEMKRIVSKTTKDNNIRRDRDKIHKNKMTCITNKSVKTKRRKCQ